MKVTKVLSRNVRRTFFRGVTAVALLGSTAIVGVAGTASATQPYSLVVTTQPSNGASGAPLATQPVVKVENGTVLVTTDSTSVVTATITSGGGYVSSGTVTLSAGVGTFSSLALNALVGSYTLTFSSPSYNSGVSNPVAVSVGAASQLVITTPPSSGEVSGVALSTQPVVKVEDSGGNVITGTTGSATTTVSPVSGSVSAGGTAAFSNGVATFSGLTLTGTSGLTYTITFTGGGFTATSGPITMSGPANHLVISAPPSTTAFSGTPLSTQPVITVVDISGNPVTSDTSTVTATLTTPSTGTVSNGTKAAVAGVGTFSGLALNALAGSYTLTFSDPGLTSAVSATIVVSTGGASKLMILNPPPASTTSGTALTPQPQVEITDSGGNRVTSNASLVTATFTSGGVSLTNATATASAGLATFSGLTLNALAGPYTLTFSDGGLTPVVSNSITVAAGAATQLVITTQPSSSVASSVALAQQPVVKVEDSGGNVVTSNFSTVTASITSSADVVSHNTAAVSAGVATFSGLALNAPIGTYTLTFADAGLASAVSSNVSVTSGTATKLVIVTQPSVTGASGAALAQAPVVAVEDASGNVVTSDTSVVVARITAGGVSVTNGAKSAVSGFANFSGLALNAPVGTYTLSFSDGALTPVTSTSIALSVGAASQLVITTEPSSFSASGAALAQQPVVKVEDSGGNVVTSVTSGYVTATVAVGVGGSVSAGALAPITAGVANFSALALTGTAGNQYGLIFSGDGLSVLDAARISMGTNQSPLVITSTTAFMSRVAVLTTSGGSGTGVVTYSAINGRVLSYSSTGTCIVTATKAASGTFLVTASAPTTVTISTLPIPRILTLGFRATSAVLSAGEMNAIAALARNLSNQAVVRIISFAPGNLGIAKQRAAVVARFLQARVHVTVRLIWVTRLNVRAVKIQTVSQ